MKTWDERAQDVLAQGCTTYSRRSDQFVKGVFPTHAVSADGCYTKCCDGQIYMDFQGGLGSNILCIENNYGLPCIEEVMLAEMVRERVPCCEKMKILKTGSEACQAAVRIARAYKQKWDKADKRDGIGTGYHGWHNIFIAEEKPGLGTIDEHYMKLDSLGNVIDKIKECLASVSYVIVEPVQLDDSNTHRDMLLKLRQLCTEYGIVLIFDEVITGFRVPLCCVANMFNIQPDIIVLGKAMANGYPISIVGGKREIMDTPGYFISSTFASEQNSIQQAIATLTALTPSVLDSLWAVGKWFQESFNKFSDSLKLVGIPTKAVFKGDETTRALFLQEMCKRKYLFGKAWHITLAHVQAMPKLNKALRECQEVLDGIRDGKYNLEGQLPGEVFKRY